MIIDLGNDWRVFKDREGSYTNYAINMYGVGKWDTKLYEGEFKSNSKGTSLTETKICYGISGPDQTLNDNCRKYLAEIIRRYDEYAESNSLPNYPDIAKANMKRFCWIVADVLDEPNRKILNEISNSRKLVKSSAVNYAKIQELIYRIDDWTNLSYRYLTDGSVKGYSDGEITPGDASDIISEIHKKLTLIQDNLGVIADNLDDKEFENDSWGLGYDGLKDSFNDAYAYCSEWLKPQDFLNLSDDIFNPLKKLFNEKITSSRKVIKSANSYGWEVDSSEVPEALDLFVEYVGKETALEEIARAMGTDVLEENLDWVIRQWGFSEDVEDMDDVWEKFEYAKEVMGADELYENLTQAAGYDELAEDLAFIFRQYDFREWDERKGNIDSGCHGKGKGKKKGQ